MKRRVVVTGRGVVSPIGVGLEAFRRALGKGVSGLSKIESFDWPGFPVTQACEVKDFNGRSEGTHLLDPFIQYGVRAAREALEEARFEPQAVDPFRVGISFSSSKGGVHTIDRFKERFRKHPSAILGARIYTSAVPNFAAQWIARRWKIQGPAKCYVAACATGTVAVIEGARMVADGTVDYCVAGSSDASIVPLMLAGYRRMKVLARGPLLPFDQRRTGFVVGEGAGALLLESLDSALARRATILGEIIGTCYGSDATHPIHYDRRGDALARTLTGLVTASGFGDAGALDYVNLHGTGTRLGDIYETEQIKKAFGPRAYQIPMSSIKSMTGHMLGASGAVEAVACLIAMEDGLIPPTIGLEKPDPACDLDYTPLRARQARLRVTASISMGFGGHIAAVAFRRE